MRTTLTLDADVAAALERLRKQRDVPLKSVVNEALRRGIDQLEAKPKPRAPFRTGTVSLGTPRLASLDNIGEVLALIEGDRHR
ncbi:MAG: DUF2191 domain-containing protein [Alphaproteobacteria bacterium]|nr:DUF2191 domain-containing protein [Alphaproteobacteria bacterium]